MKQDIPFIRHRKLPTHEEQIFEAKNALEHIHPKLFRGDGLHITTEYFYDEILPLIVFVCGMVDHRHYTGKTWMGNYVCSNSEIEEGANFDKNAMQLYEANKKAAEELTEKIFKREGLR